MKVLPPLSTLALRHLCAKIADFTPEQFASLIGQVDLERMVYRAFNENPYFQGPKFNAFIRALPKEGVPSIDLSKYNHTTNSTVEVVAEHFGTHLKSFTLQAQDLTDEAILSLVQRAPNLEHLILISPTKLTKTSSLLISMILGKNLKTLDIGSAISIRGGGTNLQYTRPFFKQPAKIKEAIEQGRKLVSPIGTMISRLNPALLSTLNLSGAHFSWVDLDILGKLIAQGNLHRLNLSRCRLDDYCMSILAVSGFSKVKKPSNLRALDISRNVFGDKGTLKFVQALCGSTPSPLPLLEPEADAEAAATDFKSWTNTLTEAQKLSYSNFGLINASRNNIGPLGAQAFAHCLLHSQCGLKKLCLEHNPIGDVGVTAIAKVLPFNSIYYLDLSCCSFGDPGAEALANVLSTASPDYPGLKSLYMNINKIEENGGVKIAQAISVNPTLQTVHMFRNSFAPNGEIAAAALKIARKNHNTDVKWFV